MKHWLIALFLSPFLGWAQPDSIQWRLMNFSSNLEKDRIEKVESLDNTELFELLMDAQQLDVTRRNSVKGELTALVKELKGRRKAKHFGNKEIVKTHDFIVRRYNHTNDFFAGLDDCLLQKKSSIVSLMAVMACAYDSLGYTWNYLIEGDEWRMRIGYGIDEYTELSIGTWRDESTPLGITERVALKNYTEMVLGSEAGAIARIDLEEKATALHDIKDWRGLIAYQYYANGARYIKDSDFRSTVSPLLKAQRVHQGEMAKYFLTLCLMSEVETLLQRNMIHIMDVQDEMAYLYNSVHYPSGNLVNAIKNLAAVELYEKGQTEKLQSCYNYFQKNLTNEELKGDLAFEYHLSMAQFYYSKNSREAIPHFQLAAKLKPEHAQLTEVAFAIVNNYLIGANIYRSKYGYDSLLVLKSELPQIELSNQYDQLEYNLLTNAINSWMILRNLSKSYSYYQKWNALLSEGRYQLDTDEANQLYQELATFYSQNRDYRKCRQVLLDGIAFLRKHNASTAKLDKMYAVVKNMK